jgi:7,8-dihydro-6-hydroxymethylpterin-pyrophosphokinase
LDCDIVLYGDRRVEEADLVIPHRELRNRPFWIRELDELGVPLPNEAG